MSMSLDGSVTGPDVSPDEPVGRGGKALHQWMFAGRSGKRFGRTAPGGHGDRRFEPKALSLLEIDDLASEGRQRHGNELEVRQAERDADDRDAHQDTGDDVADREPPAREQKPDDVAD